MPGRKFLPKSASLTAKRQADHVYNNALSRGLSEGSAIAESRAVYNKRVGKRSKKRGG
jgi:hypothetical protein